MRARVRNKGGECANNLDWFEVEKGKTKCGVNHRYEHKERKQPLEPEGTQTLDKD